MITWNGLPMRICVLSGTSGNSRAMTAARFRFAWHSLRSPLSMMLLCSSSCSSNLNTFEAWYESTSLMLWNTTWWYSTSNALHTYSDPPVAAHALAAVVARGAVGIEADQSRQPARAPVHLVHDLFVVDPLEQLARERHAPRFTALAELIQKAVGDQLEAFLDQLVVDLALLLDLLRSLELGGQTGLELPKPDVVEAGRVHVVAGDTTAGLVAQPDRPVDRPIRMLGS